ncbi:hypothetical protein AVEN_232238-1 [Araneus ventricosus]|uniref:RNase H type-1 domain-containing protein n=1 Tax=Araneus ventricosus TaxID=182803 RepID=A0A4Y2J905_ARAVE|nr:hypothetical protein AVEN_232238-1 [Araneus ventricosus]
MNLEFRFEEEKKSMSVSSDDEPLAQLKRKCNLQLTNFQTKINKLQLYLNDQASNNDIFMIQSKLDSVLELCAKIECLKLDYYDITEDEQIADNDAEFEKMGDDLEYLKVRFQKILFQLNTADNVQMHKSRIPNEVFVKLPDVSLPEFNGNIDNWSNFKAQFDSLITNNSTLNETQKLFYLRSVLKGDAKLVETQEDTFNSLMKVLIDRFENKRLIVSNHILNILNIEKIQLESAKDLRNLVDTINKSLRGLKLLELEANELVHQILINVVIQKIDKETRKQYEMSLTTNELPNWDKFIEFLRKRSQVLENINGTHQQTRVKITNHGKNKNFMLKSTSKNICVLCKGGHAIYNCSAFLEMTPLQRFDKKHKLCLNCLYNSHKLSDCKSKYSCPFCQGKHNRLLCRNQNIRSAPNADMTPTLQTGETPSPSHPVTPELATPSVGGESTLHTLSSTNKIKNTALLSTAVVWVYSPIRSGYVQGRVLLDCGSQSHFLTSQFASELGLNIIPVTFEAFIPGDPSLNIRPWFCCSASCLKYSGTVKNIPSALKFISPATQLDKTDFENSVFQAELAAIHYAANWAASNNYRINIYTDSLSHSRSAFVNNVKHDLALAENLVGLSWVKAHVGIRGNEVADQNAKQAISSGEELEIPAFIPHQKTKILHLPY